MSDNTSVAHRVLRNIDIFREILELLGSSSWEGTFPPDSTGREGQRTLARLARVCKTFRDPALIVLWYALDNLDPLLAMVPNGLTNHSFSVSLSNILQTCSEVDHVQITDYQNLRLHRYTEYVRKVAFSGVISDEGASKLAFLYRASRGTPLFPGLQSLRLFTWPVTMTEASLLFSCRLEDFIISEAYPPPFPPPMRRSCRKLSSRQQQQMCMQLLCRQCPHLSRVAIHALLKRTELSCLEPVFRLKHIESLAVNCPEAPAISDVRPLWLERLSMMDRLFDLQFDLVGYPPNAIATMTLGGFDRLRYLNVSIDVEMLCLLFGSWCPHALVSIQIYMETQDETITAMQWFQMKAAMEKLVSVAGKTLKNFQFKQLRRSENAFVASSPAILKTIQPITSVRSLERFTLSWFQSFNVTDQDICDFAKAWPDLQKISIHQWGTPATTHPTVQALVDLATTCLGLKEIELDLALDSLPPLDSLPRTKLKLERIRFDDYDDLLGMEQMQSVAAIVHRLFPLLQPLCYHDLGRDPSLAQIMGYVKELQEEEERNSAIESLTDYDFKKDRRVNGY